MTAMQVEIRKCQEFSFFNSWYDPIIRTKYIELVYATYIIYFYAHYWQTIQIMLLETFDCQHNIVCQNKLFFK